VASWPAKQQESRHTTFGELKFEEKNMKNIFQFACDRWEIILVPERKYFCHPKIFYV
jgi:hypothetical protein